MQQYPKWIYHKAKPAKVVKTKEEHEAHGPEWKESPAHLISEEPKPKTKKKEA